MAHTYTIESKPASGNGDLAGWIGRCECGEIATSSIRINLDMHMRAHVDYMVRKYGA